MAGLDLQRYTYTPVYVQAVQVTTDNMTKVAKWCGGTINKRDDPPADGGRPYIKVNTVRPMRLRQTQAFVGDWVVKTGGGFKVYLNNAFGKAFKPAPKNDPAAEELLKEIFRDKSVL